MADRFPVALLQPIQVAFIVHADAVGHLGQLVLEGFGDAARQRRAVDHKAQFRIQGGRTRVEVERPDEDALPVHREGLGVQAGTRAAEGPHALVALDLARHALHLEQFHAGCQQVLAALERAVVVPMADDVLGHRGRQAGHA
ncbi:hypothetical protein G6F22_012669 [Rhizopus arrhizus]|nr:hypothetical protein G6F22_012669 [Rhizopus arrhizus]